MIFGISYETIIAYLFAITAVIILLAIFARPLKWLLKLLLNSAAGALLMFVFNFFGGFAKFTIGINPASILTVGLLGIPGFALLILLKLFLF